jgi:hypothetical protein
VIAREESSLQEVKPAQQHDKLTPMSTHVSDIGSSSAERKKKVSKNVTVT